MSAAATVLGVASQHDPSCRQGIGFVCRGQVDGRVVEVRGSYGADGSGTGTDGVSVTLKVHGSTYGIVAYLGAIVSSEGTPTVETRCLPQAVGAAWLDEGVRRALVPDRLATSIEAEADGIRLCLSPARAADPEVLSRLTHLGVHMLRRLPSAIDAAGMGQYLASSLSSHPEVVAHHQAERRRTLTRSTSRAVERSGGRNANAARRTPSCCAYRLLGSSPWRLMWLESHSLVPQPTCPIRGAHVSRRTPTRP